MFLEYFSMNSFSLPYFLDDEARDPNLLVYRSESNQSIPIRYDEGLDDKRFYQQVLPVDRVELAEHYLSMFARRKNEFAQ